MDSARKIWPEECQHKGRMENGGTSCRFCEFSEAPGLADGGCVLANDPEFSLFMIRRRQYIIEAFGDPVGRGNRTQRREYAKKRARIIQMLEHCTDYETLKILDEKEN